MKSLLGDFFIFPFFSILKNLGGDKEKNENKNISFCGNSDCAVLAVFSGFTYDCR
jgi:hypothetical protein